MASKAQKRAAKAAARVSKTLATKKAEEVKVETTETKPTPAPKVEDPKPTPAPEQKPVETKPTEKPEEKTGTTKEEAKTPKTSQSKEQVKEKKPKEKIPTLETEEVDVPSISKNVDQFAANSIADKNVGRIDANHSIDLMTAIKDRYLSGENVPEELKKAMYTQFDILTFVNLMRWNAQTEHDFGEAGIVLSKDVFEQLKATLSASLGITLKGLPAKKDGQMELDFKETVATAPKEIKETIEKEVKVPRSKEDDEPLPKYDSTMNEKQCIEALNIIATKHRERSIDQILQDMIDFVRKAWKLEKEDITKVLSVMLEKLQDPSCFIIKTWGTICYRSLMTGNNPFTAHCNVRKKIQQYGYTEKQIADITNFFIDVRNTTVFKDDATLYDKHTKAITDLINTFNEKRIKMLIKDVEARKNHQLPDIEGLTGDTTINTLKLTELMKLTYGNLNSKELTKKLTELSKYYREAWK